MKFKIVGIGPGGRDYVIPAALRAIREADVLVGAPRVLEVFGDEKKVEFVYRSNLDAVLNYVDVQRNQKKLAVLVSGDPGFHSLLGVFSRRFDDDDYEVIPGISSFQTAMARRGKPWQSDLTVSCHGKGFSLIRREALDALDAGRRVILLTDEKRNPAALALDFLEAKIGDRPVWLGENLTLADEDVRQTSLVELAGAGDSPAGAERDSKRAGRLCVMIIE